MALRLCSIAYAAFANVTVHSATLAFSWSLLLYEGDYARVFGYVILVNGLRALLALPYVCKPGGNADTLHPDHARLALVLTGVGGILTGALLCMRGVMYNSNAAVVATPIVLVILSLFDPSAALPVFVALDANRGSVRQQRLADRAFERTFMHFRTARIIGIVAGQAAFAITVLGAPDTAPVVQITLGSLLMAAQILVLPLGSGPSSRGGGGGETSGATRVAATPLRETDFGLDALRMGRAIAIEVAVALALATATSTWTHDAVARWDKVYSSAATAWTLNGACVVGMAAAVYLTKREFVRLDVDVDASLFMSEQRASAEAREPTAVAPAPVPGVTLRGARRSPTIHPTGRVESDAALSGGDDDVGALAPETHRRLMGSADGMGASVRVPVLSEAYMARLRHVAYTFGFVLLVAIVTSAILDISMSDESTLHVVVSAVMIIASIQLDQVAEQVALASNAHLSGTRLHAVLVHTLAGVRVAAYVIGFVVAWFWRDQLHATAYVFAFLALSYATL